MAADGSIIPKPGQMAHPIPPAMLIGRGHHKLLDGQVRVSLDTCLWDAGSINSFFFFSPGCVSGKMYIGTAVPSEYYDRWNKA